MVRVVIVVIGRGVHVVVFDGRGHARACDRSGFRHSLSK